jgi:hypothetical protein
MRTKSRMWFSGEVFRKVRAMIKHVRLGKCLGRLPGFRNTLTGQVFRANDPGQGSGWKAYYDKNGKSITFEEQKAMGERKTVGDAYLRVIGGLYTDRLDVDFLFAACVEHPIKKVNLWNEFNFWLVSSAAKPGNLVLRLRSSYNPVETALGALLEIFTDEVGRILMGGTSDKYEGHVRELILELQPPIKTGLEDLLEADLKIPEIILEPLAVIHQELGREVDIKAFRVFGRSIHNYDQRIRIKHQGTLRVQWEKLTHGPVRQSITWDIGGLRRR